MVLRAKTTVQLILSGIPMLFAVVCAAVIVRTTPAVRLLLCALPVIYAAFDALFCTFIGLKMPLLNWTDETAPIKQSGAVVIAIFGAWGVGIAFAGLYLLIGYKIGAACYLLGWAVLFAAAALLLLRWLDTKGAAAFDAL